MENRHLKIRIGNIKRVGHNTDIWGTYTIWDADISRGPFDADSRVCTVGNSSDMRTRRFMRDDPRVAMTPVLTKLGFKEIKFGQMHPRYDRHGRLSQIDIAVEAIKAGRAGESGALYEKPLALAA